MSSAKDVEVVGAEGGSVDMIRSVEGDGVEVGREEGYHSGVDLSCLGERCEIE